MTTDKELDQGYSICECGKGVHLLQAGTEAELHMCAMYKQEVVDKDNFFRERHGLVFMSKD